MGDLPPGRAVLSPDYAPCIAADRRAHHGAAHGLFHGVLSEGLRSAFPYSGSPGIIALSFPALPSICCHSGQLPGLHNISQKVLQPRQT